MRIREQEREREREREKVGERRRGRGMRDSLNTFFSSVPTHNVACMLDSERDCKQSTTDISFQKVNKRLQVTK